VFIDVLDEGIYFNLEHIGPNKVKLLIYLKKTPPGAAK
jgi:hypothetical protein